MKKLKYDINQYGLREVLCSYLEVESLEALHTHTPNKYSEVFERKNDQSTEYHAKYYNPKNPLFKLYKDFIKNEVISLYNEKIVYQKIPNLRIHFPSNIAVGEWHRDRDYRDTQWASAVKEQNYFLPLTDAYNTNTVWAETSDGKEDYRPMNCKYGEFIGWNASNLKHGNKLNTTDITRVSIDFRVISFSNFKDDGHPSINTKTPFAIGGYYDIMEKK